MDVYGFAKKLMNNDDFNGGGIIRNERKYLDSIGFEYTVKDGCIYNESDDMREFYRAMETLRMLQKKYGKEN